MIFFKGKISVETLINYLNGSVDSSVREDIEEWIGSSRENQEFYLRLQDIWKNHEDLSSLLSTNRANDWAKVANAIDKSPLIRKRINTASKETLLSIIAAAVILIVISSLAYYSGK